MATAEQIAWAAGLFDGEGSITHNARELQVHLKNTDAELVERFEAAVQRGRVYGPYANAEKDGYRRKPYWLWLARGDAAHDVIDLLSCWLSQRRLEQARLHGVTTPYTGQTKTVETAQTK